MIADPMVCALIGAIAGLTGLAIEGLARGVGIGAGDSAT
jgi:hypothetical protein